MPNQCNDGAPWDYWVTLSPQGSSSNGQELVRGGMWPDSFDNTLHWNTGSMDCKSSIVDCERASGRAGLPTRG